LHVSHLEVEEHLRKEALFLTGEISLRLLFEDDQDVDVLLREGEIGLDLLRLRVRSLSEVHQRRMAEREDEGCEIDLRKRLVAHDGQTPAGASFSSSSSPSSSSAPTCSVMTAAGWASAGCGVAKLSA